MGDLSFSTSTSVGGATGAQWVLGFTASSTGALNGGVDGNNDGTITVDAPSGTNVAGTSTCSDYIVDDTTAGKSFYPDLVTASLGGTQVTIMLNNGTSDAAIVAGNEVTLTINDVTNPAGCTAFSGIKPLH